MGLKFGRGGVGLGVMKFEHEFEEASTGLQTTLRMRSEDGWELVAVTKSTDDSFGTDTFQLFFKRPAK